MSDGDLDRLRRAFASLEEPGAESGPPPSAEDVWRAAAGELDPARTRELAEQLVDDPQLAREWRLALDLVREERGAVDAAVPFRPRWRRPILAMAAIALIALGVAAIWRVSSPPAPVYRSSDGTRIEAVAGDGEALPRDGFVLRWTPLEGTATYRVAVSDARLELVHEQDGIRSTSLQVPPEDLESVAAGERVLWQVTAVTDEGAAVTSPTFVATVR